MANHSNLAEAIQVAADTIGGAAGELGTTYHAAQSYYGVAAEALVGGRWVRVGDLAGGEAVAAVRLCDCDGERGRECETVEAVAAEMDRWLRRLEAAVACEIRG